MGAVRLVTGTLRWVLVLGGVKESECGAKMRSRRDDILHVAILRQGGYDFNILLPVMRRIE